MYTNRNKRGHIEDMVLLSKITDSDIEDNLRKRYMDDLIYTYIGPVLIAVNPFKKLDYFTQKEIDMYQGTQAHENPPHIYALADAMFRNMLIDEESQCVIISGESGAGKTESAKLIMNYIAAVSGKGGDAVERIKHIILESNPLLEAFGNAKTLRNNNSSRFGKYFEIQFNRGGSPVGGTISNFLLEKSRVVGLKRGERNFHIFYQMTKGASAREKEQLGMTDPEYFYYLRQSEMYDADGIDDVADYGDVKNAMKVCGLSEDQMATVFQMTAGVLHLGNVDFVEKGNNAVVRDRDTLSFPAYLLGITEEALNEKLISRQMQSGSKRNTVYDVPLNVEQAVNSRDALAKSLYARLFDWIVQAINRAMGSQSKQFVLNFGVLDIYGFEIFEKNGFEQFCINYVNEKLQQIFIELTLKSEQEEYVKEGIKWTPIDFFNNKVVVELIESKKPVGIMPILDDCCMTMHAQNDGADAKFVEKLRGAVSGHPHFIGTDRHFIVKHYAGQVDYDSDGFCEANKDTLFKDLIILMKGSSKPFIAHLFPEDPYDDKKRPTTFSFKIRNQANDLVTTLMRCRPHYVRCIKPNETKRPKDWESKRVDHQVKYLNLKENIRIRRAGFAYRQLFDKFVHRFGILTDETFPRWNGRMEDGVRHIMRAHQIEEYQIGVSKVFIKNPEHLFVLEEARERKYHQYAKIIQRAYRRYKLRKYFMEMKKKGQDIFYERKERRRFSLHREFDGDYLHIPDNPIIKALIGKDTKVKFADAINKYDRRFKMEKREVVITDTHFILLGMEKVEKNKWVKVIKRKTPITSISNVSLSTKSDDFVIIKVPGEYDSIFETVCKTEMVTVLSELYKSKMGSALPLTFSDQIAFVVKKTKWEGSSQREISFVHAPSLKFPVVTPSGKGAVVQVPPGLPSNTRPNPNRFQAQQQQQRNKGGGGGGYKSNPPKQNNYANNNTYANNNPASPNMGYHNNNNNNGPRSHMANHIPQNASSNAPRMPINQGGAQQFKLPGPPAVPQPAKNMPKKPALPTCTALYPYNATEADELSFQVGDVITVINQDDPGWWTGMLNGRRGLFPANYVRM